MNDWEEIIKLLPHRFPFILIDRVLEWKEGKRITVIKNVTFNEPFFSGHFPSNPLMPGVLIVEAIAQAGGLLIVKSYPDLKNEPAFLVAIDKARFKREIRPGDRMQIEVTIKRRVGNVFGLKGKVTVDTKVAAEADIMISINKSGEKE